MNCHNTRSIHRSSSEPYEVTTRKQYTFRISNKDLACLLTFIVSPRPAQLHRNCIDHEVSGKVNVNIVSYNILAITDCKCGNRCSMVKIVVGTDDPNDPRRGGDTSTDCTAIRGDNKTQNRIFRQTLKQMGIKFTTQTVVQVFNGEATSGTPGAFRILYTALLCGGIDVLAAYTGEPALTPDLRDRGVLTTFFEVPKEQICRTVNLLRNFDTSDPDDNLCINVNNVQKKCPRLRNKKCGCSSCQSH